MDELQVWTEGSLGRLRLNRPRAINSLTRAMIDKLTFALKEWETDPAVKAVFLDGAGERGLCSGADVRALREQFLAGDPVAREFLPAEFALNALISTYPKPYVAWMDGVVMGGGLGVSTHGSVRLATPRAVMAMPETIIGFFPDVGVTWQLSHAPGELGTHLALTGTTVTGADAVLLGLADVLVDEDAIDTVLAKLRRGEVLDAATMGDLHPSAPLAAHRAWIDECYAGAGTIEPASILEELRLIGSRLRAHGNPAAREAADLIAQRAPLSVAVALHAVRQAAGMVDATQVLERDGRIGPRLAAGPDFVEGVRAQLVDKDHAPKWKHTSIDDLDASDLARIVG